MFTEREDTTDILNVDCPRIVSADQNAQLVREFSFAEFTAAIKHMHPDKDSGPDGLNPAFFQSFWNVMGTEVFKQCKDWLRLRNFPGELNCTNVVLILKKKMLHV